MLQAFVVLYAYRYASGFLLDEQDGHIVFLLFLLFFKIYILFDHALFLLYL